MTEPRDAESTGQRARGTRPMDPPEVGDILDAFVDEAPRKRGQSERTMETYRGHARSFLRYVLDVHGELEVHSLTDDDVVGFLATAKAKGDASTARTTKLMSVRSFGAWMVDAGRHPGPILGQAVKPPRSTTAPRRPYRPQDANRFLESAWTEAKDLRRVVGAHIIVLGFGSGLRPAELLNLTIAQVDLPDHRLHVVGKGSKHRTVVLGEDATELLRRYLDDIRPQLVASDFVFVNPMSSRTSNWVGRYGESAYQAYFTRIGQISGLPGKHFPHRTRHTYATEMLRMGLEVTVLQRQLGHSKITTTMTYLHLADDDIENAVRRAYGDQPLAVPLPIRLLPPSLPRHFGIRSETGAADDHENTHHRRVQEEPSSLCTE